MSSVGMLSLIALLDPDVADDSRSRRLGLLSAVQSKWPSPGNEGLREGTVANAREQLNPAKKLRAEHQGSTLSNIEMTANR